METLSEFTLPAWGCERVDIGLSQPEVGEAFIFGADCKGERTAEINSEVYGASAPGVAANVRRPVLRRKVQCFGVGMPRWPEPRRLCPWKTRITLGL